MRIFARVSGMDPDHAQGNAQDLGCDGLRNLDRTLPHIGSAMADKEAAIFLKADPRSGLIGDIGAQTHILIPASDAYTQFFTFAHLRQRGLCQHFLDFGQTLNHPGTDLFYQHITRDGRFAQV